jgi:two-component sensor histidine kinase
MGPAFAVGAVPLQRDESLELAVRTAAVRIGYWLGWASIVTVLAGLAFDVGVKHRWLIVAFTLCAAAANTMAMVVPWRAWLATWRGRLLLDLWSGGLIAFVALLAVAGGSTFTLLLFLAIPFIAVVQIGWRRGFWLGVSAGTCAMVAAFGPLSPGATAMRLALVAAVVGVALILARTIRREHGRAEIERTLAKEASHRIKNDLQTVADLLLLGRPAQGDATAFDDTAARIKSIAVVHKLLSETDDRIDGGALLRSIADGAPAEVEVEADRMTFDAQTAQKLGIIANELMTNAYQHGAEPIVVQLSGGPQTRLRVADGGCCTDEDNGFGLQLVRRLVEQGLHGQFDLAALPGGGTRADVVFPAATR